MRADRQNHISSLGATAFGGRLFEHPFVKPWIRPSKVRREGRCM